MADPFEGTYIKKLFDRQDVDDEEFHWMYQVIDAATTLVDCVNGCTPYIDLRKAAKKLDEVIHKGIE